MTFNGVLSPSTPGTTIAIVYTPPTGSPINHQAETSSDGSYTDTFTHRTKGIWHAQAHWAGDDGYLPSDSSPCSF
jgi:hypothetical protein